VLNQGTFRATTALASAEVFIIAVPTPITPDKQADLQAVWAAATALVGVLKTGDLVVLESTVPVGTTKQLADFLQTQTGLQPGRDFSLAFSPERVLPDKIFYELKHNARIVGGIDEQSGQRAQQLFQMISLTTPAVTDCTTAELVKLVENSARDTQLAFAYQVANLARTADLDPYQVIRLANLHPRVQILTPTCGVGGHCIAVDPWFLVASFPQSTKLLRLVRELNDQVPTEILGLIDQQLQAVRLANAPITATGTAAEPSVVLSSNTTQLQTDLDQFAEYRPATVPLRVLVLGLAYKANSDDLRESPALKIALTLQQRPDLALTVCDPQIAPANLAKYRFTQVLDYAELRPAQLGHFDLIVLLVGHREFQSLLAEQARLTLPILNYAGLEL
ncbi:MAG TPA: nucleotide sugar dehydrogenase, partial [Candidatus Babeliales bacterium]|nr:nucleotide sugar dehydrogenase [Candidatus Babeliales bacterium]